MLARVLSRPSTRPLPHLTLSTRARACRALASSAVSGPLDPPLLQGTLSDYFHRTVVPKHAERTALVCRFERPCAHGGPVSKHSNLGGRETHLVWDFAEFERHVQALARGLVALGVKKGDRVGVVMGNNSAYACLQWACASVGAILVTINPAYRTHELVAVLKLVSVSHLFLVPRIRTSNYLQMLSSALPTLSSSPKGQVSDPALPELRKLVVVHDAEAVEEDIPEAAIDFRDVFIWEEHAHEARAVADAMKHQDQDDVINMQFTSGTTGAPKAVCLTHHNLLNNGYLIGRCMELTPTDILCNAPPLFHCFGLVLGNLAAWTHGSCVVYPSPVFDPRAVLSAVVDERCTALHGVPTHFLGVLSELDRRVKAGENVDVSSLRTGIAAGSPVPEELMRQLITRLNLQDLTIAYGMTETSPVSFQSVTTDSFQKRVETVGRIMPHTCAKIVDHQGCTVPVGTPGELHVAGYLLQKGYWQDEEQTKKVMKWDGPEGREGEGTLWMHTGDEGVMDEDGFLRIVGRIKDIIIRGGENLFPVQIENALTAHPHILEAAAVAVPDPRYGEVVGAWIVRRPSDDAGNHPSMSRADVRAVVTESMNPQNAPAWVWFVGEDAPELSSEGLPKTASGKVQKHILRDWSKKLASADIGKV